MFPEPYFGLLRELVRLRGVLTPFIYTLARETQVSATPFMRPLWWDHAEIGLAWTVEEQYMFGPLLVRPIADQDFTPRLANVWLPPLPSKGTWISWKGDAIWSSNVTVSLTAPINLTPVFVPVGTILPMWPPGLRTGSPASRSIMWTTWVTTSASMHTNSTLYEDDGETLNYRSENAFGTTAASLLVSTDTIEMTISPLLGEFMGRPEYRTHILQLRGNVSAGLTEVFCTIENVTTPLTLGLSGDYSTPAKWWRVTASDFSELSCPVGAVVAVCPPARASSSVQILLN